jgi:hypothetical protein
MNDSTKSTLLKVVVVLSIVFLFFGLNKFLSTTHSTILTNTPIRLTAATYNQTRHSLVVEPTSTATADTSYLIVFDNTLFTQDFSVSWDSLELSIHKSKTLTNRLSPDAFTAIQIHPSYTIKTYRVDYTRPIVWIILPLIVLVLVCIYLMPQITSISKKHPEWRKSAPEPDITTNSIVDEVNSVGAFCPLPSGRGRCGAYNVVNYLKGETPYGKLVKCQKCGRIYTHGELK